MFKRKLKNNYWKQRMIFKNKEMQNKNGDLLFYNYQNMCKMEWGALKLFLFTLNCTS